MVNYKLIDLDGSQWSIIRICQFSGTTNNSTVKFIVGGQDNGSWQHLIHGYGFISNLRIVEGETVYTSSFHTTNK